MQIFLLILIGAVGIVFGYSMSRRHMHEHLSRFANTERRAGKERKKRMILKHLKDRSRLTNAEAQELLGVSDSTVVRYFDELEVEGRVRQVGDVGSGVYYELL